MGEDGRATAGGIEIAPASLEGAEELARIVRELASTLPFGAEPLDFLSALEAEAGDGASAGDGPSTGNSQ